MTSAPSLDDAALAQLRASSAASDRVIATHPELYHYTDEAGLKGILQSNSFRASYFADMNDAREIHELRPSFVAEMMSRLIPVFEQMRKEKPIGHAVWRQGIAQQLSYRWARILYNTIFDENEETRSAFCCTTSFCSHVEDQPYERDNGLLSQWRGYGKDGGFCLVFDSAALWKLFEEERSKYLYLYTDVRKAHYSRSGTEALGSFVDLLDESEKVIKAGVSGSVEFTVDQTFLPFLESATAFKHQGFFEEREVRLIAMAGTQLVIDKLNGVQGFQPRPLKEVFTSTRDGRTRRYILLFGKDFPPLPLRRVIVGPSARQANNIAIARNMVRDKIPVSTSRTPFVG
jgi:Protein of unknown function (DUF2971)